MDPSKFDCKEIKDQKDRKLCIDLNHPFKNESQIKNLLTGNKDLNIKILLSLSDEDLNNFCFVNKSAYELCNKEEFWMNKYMLKFGNLLKDLDINKYRGNATWKEYYFWTNFTLRSDDIYYVSAKADEYKRDDILQLIEILGKKQGIKNIKITIGGSDIDKKWYYYYLDPDRKQQGRMEIYVEKDGIEKLTSVKNWKFGEPHGEQMEIYWNNNFKYRYNYDNGNLVGLQEEWYENGNQKSKTIYNKVGKKDGLREKWYENGNKKSVVAFKNGIKDQILERYFENGDVKKIERTKAAILLRRLRKNR